MRDDVETYELYAIRYGTRPGRSTEHFIGGDTQDRAMPMDYFTFIAKNARRSIAIDTGFNAATAPARGRTALCCPVDTLERLGVDPSSIRDVILTHLHNDHAGNLERFSGAVFHLQEAEMHHVAGRHMKHLYLAHHYDVEEIVTAIRLNFQGRMNLHSGPAEIAPGITVHPTGGHSAGLQFVRVSTPRGMVVLAGDAAHFYENIETRRPFAAAYHIGEMFDSFDRISGSAPTRDHIIPGHDPELMSLYPPPSRELAGIVASLHVEPRQPRPESLLDSK